MLIRCLRTQCSKGTPLRIDLSRDKSWSCPSCVFLEKSYNLSRPVPLTLQGQFPPWELCSFSPGMLLNWSSKEHLSSCLKDLLREVFPDYSIQCDCSEALLLHSFKISYLTLIPILFSPHLPPFFIFFLPLSFLPSSSPFLPLFLSCYLSTRISFSKEKGLLLSYPSLNAQYL